MAHLQRLEGGGNSGFEHGRGVPPSRPQGCVDRPQCTEREPRGSRQGRNVIRLAHVARRSAVQTQEA